VGGDTARWLTETGAEYGNTGYNDHGQAACCGAVVCVWEGVGGDNSVATPMHASPMTCMLLPFGVRLASEPALRTSRL
jgi:hypothetical protein